MELKHVTTKIVGEDTQTFNRTTMELKQHACVG